MSRGDGLRRGELRGRQEPLCARYRQAPDEARITDGARTTFDPEHDPVHGLVTPGAPGRSTSVAFGIHRAIGGDHDRPNPGDLLCAALASCLDSSIRMIADRMAVDLAEVVVDVTGEVDVRGTLVVDREVPVGFRRFDVRLSIEPREGTDPGRVARLIAAAEHSCVNLQTLRAGAPVTLATDVRAKDVRDPPERR